MTKKSDAPAIRFKGFSDAWEQRKLSELTSMHARIGWQNLRTSEFLDSGNYMLITGTDFNDGAINFSTCHYVERERYEQDRNIQIHNGSILITKDGTLGKVAYVQGLSMPATLNAGVFNVQIKDANNVDEKYLFQYLKAPFLMDYVDKKATGGTIKHLNQSILVDFPVILPQRSEQTLIGAFFQQLDNLITLHQRKFEKLTNVKKSMLEKMFPQNGSSYPEIRFKGFTDPWEQRKLTEFVESFSGLTYTPNDVQENGTLVLRSSNVSNGEVVDADNVYVNPQVVNSENVKVGDIVVVVRNGSRSLIGKHAQIKAFMPNTVIGAFMTGIRSECPEFTNALLNTSRFEEEIAMNMGATINQITGYMFSKMEFKVPCLDEQKKIGEYFEKLDRLVTLHQRQPFLHSPPDISLIVQLTPPFYTFSWEQRKWINTVDISTNMVDPKSGKYDLLPHVAPGNIESFTGRLYDNVKLVGEENLISGKFVFNVGDIVYGKINPQLGKYVFARFSGLTSADAYVLNAKNGIVQKFLYAVIQTRDFYDYSVSVSKRSGMPKINRDELNAYSYWAPSESEQLKIGEYLLTLDHLITLHQRKPFLMKWRTSDANRNQTNRLVL